MPSEARPIDRATQFGSLASTASAAAQPPARVLVTARALGEKLAAENEREELETAMWQVDAQLQAGNELDMCVACLCVDVCVFVC